MVNVVHLSVVFVFSISHCFTIGLSKNSSSPDRSKAVTISDSELYDTSVWITQDNQCPLLFRYNNATGTCECSVDEVILKDSVKCSNEGDALIRYNDCITYDEERNVISVGFCPYFEIRGHTVAKPGFIKLPENISDLNIYMCEPMNRKGLLCSKCKYGFGLSATSPKQKCSKCTMNFWLALVLNMLLELVPVFIFYIIILAFQINIISPPMPSFILFSNLILINVTYNLFYVDETFYADNSIMTLYGVWTLDFFRLIIPPFCISPHLNALHIHYIQSISTIFPFFLIALTYVSIKLHSCNFRVVVWTWKVLNFILLKCIKVEQDKKKTVIDTFATFFLLSFAKLTLTLLLPLHPLTIYVVNNTDLTGSKKVNSLTYPTDEFLSLQHVQLIIPSLFLFLFVLLPPVFVLTLYPFRPFRSLLLKCLPQRFKGYLNIFVEKYYYCYRDGLDGGRDLRTFAALYFFVILFWYMSWTIHKSYFLIGLLLGGCAIIIALVQPYKKKYMVVFDSLIFANMATLSFAFDRNIYALASDSYYRIIILICYLLPLFGLICSILYKVFNKSLRTVLNNTKTKLKQWQLQYCKNNRARSIESGVHEERDLQQDHIDINYFELPDRMYHPEEYTPQDEET